MRPNTWIRVGKLSWVAVSRQLRWNYLCAILVSGLSLKCARKIFDVFVQAEPAKERAQGGLGIGLALVKALVELHGGEVDVQSDGRDQGCQFTVKLPRSIVVGAA